MNILRYLEKKLYSSFGLPVFGIIIFCLAFSSPLLAHASPEEELIKIITKERQLGRDCDGSSATFAPIIFNAQLQEIGDIAIATNGPLAEVLEVYDTAPQNVTSLWVNAENALEAFAILKANSCPTLLSANLAHIAVAKRDLQWLVLLAEDETTVSISNDESAPSVSYILPAPSDDDDFENTSRMSSTTTPPEASSPIEPATSSDETQLLQESMQEEQQPVTHAPVSQAQQPNSSTFGTTSTENKADMVSQGRYSASEMAPAEPQVTGTYRYSRGTFVPTTESSSLLLNDPTRPAEELVSDEIPKLDRNRQAPIVFESPTEALPAEPQITGVYVDGRYFKRVDEESNEVPGYAPLTTETP